MIYRWLFSLLAVATLASAVSTTPTTLSKVTIFSPPANYTDPRTLYARTIQLQQACGLDDEAAILATWENYLPNNDSFPYFPIYVSHDNGKTWSERSRLYDQVNGWGARYQPFLYELQQDIGTFKKGDLLLAGNFIPDDLSQTKIDVYASQDRGYTWKFVSSVARGGVAIPNNGLTPVWEPFIYVYDNTAIVYYSDQRDFANNGQKLVHQTSPDLLSWGAVVDDVAYNNSDWRPGMTTVSVLPNGKHMLTYEFYGASEGAFAVYYRLADDPLRFNEAEGHVLRPSTGAVPLGSPYNVWTPAGGPNGTIVVSSGGSPDLFLNTQLAEPGSAWERVAVPEKQSYSRSLLVLQDPSYVLVAGGGVLPPASNNSVTDSVIQIPAASGQNGRRAKRFDA